MLFQSPLYVLFFLVVFALCLSIRHLRVQNLLLLIAGYVFYGSWDYRFLPLLVVTTLIDFFAGLQLQNSGSPKKRKLVIALALILNLGFLVFFKYFNFFANTFENCFPNSTIKPISDLVLPIGISFYTFHGISYLVDIYRGKILATKDIVQYGVFVNFFPLLIAGPIERGHHLLPQIASKRDLSLTKIENGLRLVLWGLFKKTVISDNCAVFADPTFNPSNNLGLIGLVLGTLIFSIQIYSDFSGYTDMARGFGLMLGFEIIKNFNFPYFAISIRDFWARWHISLTGWFREYLYLPLGGNRGGKLRTVFNTLIVFLVSGLWHGANWTFVCWGIIHFLLFIPSFFGVKNQSKSPFLLINPYSRAIKATSLFFLISFSWMFFRVENMEVIPQFFHGDFIQDFKAGGSLIIAIFLSLFLLSIEWLSKDFDTPFDWAKSKGNDLFCYLFNVCIAVMFLLFFSTIVQPFIYFQF